MLSSLKNKPESKKIVIFELDIGQFWGQWLNYSPFVWRANFNGTFADWANEFLIGVDSLSISFIGSVTAIKRNGSISFKLSKVSSVSSVESTRESFYFDSSDQSIYVHLPDGDSPFLFSMLANKLFGFANHGGVYNGLLYDGKVKSVPSIIKSKDVLFFGKIKFEGGTITLDNSDGFFDTFTDDNDVFNNEARLLIGFDDIDYSEFEEVFSGNVQTFESGQTVTKVQVQDKRKSLDSPIPPKSFSSSDFSDISDDNNGSPIPYVYGSVRKIPIVCTNEDESPAPATYSFKIADTTFHSIKSIDQIYVNGGAVAHANESLASATFTLTSAQYTAGDDVTGDIQGFVDSSGDLIENGIEIIKDLIVNDQGLPFSSDFFNLIEWNASTLLAPNIGIVISERVKVNKVVQDISASMYDTDARSTPFGLLISQDNGLLSYRIINTSGAWSREIEKQEIMGTPSLTNDPTEVIAVTNIGYNKNWGSNRYVVLNDTQKEADVNLKFKTKRKRRFDTLLQTQALAQGLSTAILNVSSDVKKIVKLRTKVQNFDLEVGDLVRVNVTRASKTIIGYNKCEVLGIQKNLNDFTVDLTFRVIQRVADEDGVWTADTLTFPASLGGGDASSWDSTWTTAQKNFAKANFSYWLDDNGFADPDDPDSQWINGWAPD